MRQALPEHIYIGERERLMLLTALDTHLQCAGMGPIVRNEYEQLEQLIKWWDRADGEVEAEAGDQVSNYA